MSKVKRLRSSRYRPTDLAIGALYAGFTHDRQRWSRCAVLDFSGEGAALEVEIEAAPFLAGDTLTDLTIYRDDDGFFQGEAVVQNLRERDGTTVLGIAFRGAWMDMPRLHEREVRAGLEERFELLFSGVSELAHVQPAFKATVADLRYLLDELRRALAEEEDRLRYLDEPTRANVERAAMAVVVPRLSEQVDGAFARLGALFAPLAPGEREHHQRFLRQHLRGRFTEESALFHRCLSKPLGYAGDYEVMNMMYGDRPDGDSLYGRALTAYGRTTDAARAVSNRVGHLAREVRRSIAGRPEARVASIGCGPAREFEELLAAPDDLPARTRFTLIDVEERAIRYCERVMLERARDLEDRVEFRFIQETIRTLIRQQSIADVLDPQDAIVSVGLFDYFSDLLFQRLLSRLYALLRPRGQLWIGNFSPRNQSRFFMEQILDWYLFHRDEAELSRLAQCLPTGAQVEVQSEPLGVNLFLHVTKPPAG